MDKNYEVFKLVHDVMTIKPKHQLPTDWQEHKDYIIALRNLELGKCAFSGGPDQRLELMLTSNGYHVCSSKKRKFYLQPYECSCQQIGPVVFDSEYQKDVEHILPMIQVERFPDLLYGYSLQQRLAFFCMFNVDFQNAGTVYAAPWYTIDDHFVKWMAQKWEEPRNTVRVRISDVKFMLKIFIGLVLYRTFFPP